MNLKTTAAIASAITLSVLLSTWSTAGILAVVEAGEDRAVEAMIDDETLVVSDPIVSKKAESDDAWVASPEESVVTEFDMTMEQPWRPIIPVVTALISLDCNGNGTLDSIEIANGAMDWDGDGVLDSCEYRIGDLNLNGLIDSQDVSILLGWWGISNPLFGDLDFDGVVGPRDLGILLGRWGVVVY